MWKSKTEHEIGNRKLKVKSEIENEGGNRKLKMNQKPVLKPT